VCDFCGKTLLWYELIPVISFLVLRGRCGGCKKRIASTHLWVELALGLLFMLVGYVHHLDEFPLTLLLVRDLAVMFFLVAIFVYDALYKEIWDKWTTIPAVFFFFFSLVYQFHTLKSMLLGVVVGAGFFLLQYLISKGTWIGGGDIRFGIFMGVVLGWPHILLGILIAYVLGGIGGTLLLVTKKRALASEIAFGTYLSIGTAVTMLWGSEIISWYLGLLS
jgi:prepilin signal peptidase PulO-like enzyme (type II secretory pathway)